MMIAEVLETTINTLLDYEGNTVYNNFSTHNGEGIVVHKTTSEKIFELYDKLLLEKDKLIIAMQHEIDTLKNIPNKI